MNSELYKHVYFFLTTKHTPQTSSCCFFVPLSWHATHNQVLKLAGNRLDAAAGATLAAASTLESLTELDLSYNSLWGALTEADVTEFTYDHNNPAKEIPSLRKRPTFPSLVRLVLDGNRIVSLPGSEPLRKPGASNVFNFTDAVLPVLQTLSVKDNLLTGELSAGILMRVPILDMTNNTRFVAAKGLPEGTSVDLGTWKPFQGYNAQCAGLSKEAVGSSSTVGAGAGGAVDGEEGVVWRLDPGYDRYARCVCNAGFGGVRANCTMCPRGRYMNLNGRPRFTDLVYGGSNGDALCKECPANSTTALEGTIAATSCICNEGFTFLSSSSTSSSSALSVTGTCVACAQGLYKGRRGNQPCETCMENAFPSANRTMCFCDNLENRLKEMIEWKGASEGYERVDLQIAGIEALNATSAATNNAFVCKHKDMETWPFVLGASILAVVLVPIIVYLVYRKGNMILEVFLEYAMTVLFSMFGLLLDTADIASDIISCININNDPGLKPWHSIYTGLTIMATM